MKEVTIKYDAAQAVGAIRSVGTASRATAKDLDIFASQMTAASKRQQAFYDQSVIASKSVSGLGSQSDAASKRLAGLRENIAKAGAASSAMAGLVGESGGAIGQVAAVSTNATAILGTFSAKAGYVGLALTAVAGAAAIAAKSVKSFATDAEQLQSLRIGVADDAALKTTEEMTRQMTALLALRRRTSTWAEEYEVITQRIGALETRNNEEWKKFYEERDKLEADRIKDAKVFLDLMKQEDRLRANFKFDSAQVEGMKDQQQIAKQIISLQGDRRVIEEQIAKSINDGSAAYLDNLNEQKLRVQEIDAAIERRESRQKSITEQEKSAAEQKAKAQEEEAKREEEKLKATMDKIASERDAEHLAQKERDNAQQHELDVLEKRSDIKDRDYKRETDFIKERDAQLDKQIAQAESEAERKELEWEKEKAHRKDMEKAMERELDLARQKAKEADEAKAKEEQKVKDLLELDKKRNGVAKDTQAAMQPPAQAAAAPEQAQQPGRQPGPFERAGLGMAGIAAARGGGINAGLFDPFAFAAQADRRTRDKIRGGRGPMGGDGASTGPGPGGEGEAGGIAGAVQGLLGDVSDRDIIRTVGERAREKALKGGGTEREARQAEAQAKRDAKKQAQGKAPQDQEFLDAQQQLAEQAAEDAKAKGLIDQKTLDIVKKQLKESQDAAKRDSEQQDQLDNILQDLENMKMGNKSLDERVKQGRAKAEQRKQAQRGARGN